MNELVRNSGLTTRNESGGRPQHDPRRQVINLASDEDESEGVEIDEGDQEETKNYDGEDRHVSRVAFSSQVFSQHEDQDFLAVPSPPQAASVLHRPANRVYNKSSGTNPDFRCAVWGDYIIEDFLDDETVVQQIEKSSHHEQRPAPGDPAVKKVQTQHPHQPVQKPQIETKFNCTETVLTIFPDICRIYASDLYDNVSNFSERLIAHILDNIEKGKQYPKTKKPLGALKRKREIDEDEEEARKYSALDRETPAIGGAMRIYIKNILKNEFDKTPVAFIDATLIESRYCLFPAYRILEEADRSSKSDAPPYHQIKKRRGSMPQYEDARVELFISDIGADGDKVEILRELQAARKMRKNNTAKRAAQHMMEMNEKENLLKAQQEGSIFECGCCFEEFPLSRTIHCNSENMHRFCTACARRNAEITIGNSKYLLKCMSVDSCDAGFSLDQRSQFLDEKTIIALERNEQEAVLRLADIKNLDSCPFCPYAAEYPPTTVNRVFQCQAPDCEKASCRLCKLESHIPKSCEENAKDGSSFIRLQIEEAMSAAMIRKCNKCGTPFVKEEGCNKMTCSRDGCRNVQCYVCSKSCDYDHFNDVRRGGQEGNCPLFENVDQRHDEEVKTAEKKALAKARAENPEYTEEDLRIRMSEVVQQDEERRKAFDPHAHLVADVVDPAELRFDLANPRGLRGRYNNLPIHPLSGRLPPPHPEPRPEFLDFVQIAPLNVIGGNLSQNGGAATAFNRANVQARAEYEQKRAKTFKDNIDQFLGALRNTPQYHDLIQSGTLHGGVGTQNRVSNLAIRQPRARQGQERIGDISNMSQPQARLAADGQREAMLERNALAGMKQDQGYHMAQQNENEPPLQSAGVMPQPRERRLDRAIDLRRNYENRRLEAWNFD